jgi:hypothetical protein
MGAFIGAVSFTGSPEAPPSSGEDRDGAGGERGGSRVGS